MGQLQAELDATKTLRYTLRYSSLFGSVKAGLRVADPNPALINPQRLVQFGAGCGVLQRHSFTGADVLHGAKGGQSSLMKTTQNKFLFAGVLVDVPHSKDAWSAGGKSGGIDAELFALHGQAPLRYRPEFG